MGYDSFTDAVLFFFAMFTLIMVSYAVFMLVFRKIASIYMTRKASKGASRRYFLNQTNNSSVRS
jgi:5-bromo-4-chloroindolyl phosphate hydrolysis protein